MAPGPSPRNRFIQSLPLRSKAFISCLREGCHWRQALRFQKPHTIPSLFAPVSQLLLQRYACLSASMLPAMMVFFQQQLPVDTTR